MMACGVEITLRLWNVHSVVPNKKENQWYGLIHFEKENGTYQSMWSSTSYNFISEVVYLIDFL